MKSLTKFCLILASVFVVLGIIGVTAGMCLGARPSQFMRMAHHNGDRILSRHGWHLDFWNDWDDEIEDIQDDLAEDWNDWQEDMDDWGNLDAIDDMEKSSARNVDVQEGNFGGAHIEKLKLDLDRSSVQIYTHAGEDFRITAQNCGRYFKVKEEGDTLLLEDHRGVRKKNTLLLEIYVPERVLADIEMDLGATELYVEDLQAEKLELDLGAGEGRIENIKVEKAEIEAGVGEVQLKNLNASEKAFLGVGTGYLGVDRFDGGDLELECGVGNLEIRVQGKETDYDYTLSYGIGGITLNGEEYSGLGSEKTIHNNADKKISMDCGIGNITLECAE